MPLLCTLEGVCLNLTDVFNLTRGPPSTPPLSHGSAWLVGPIVCITFLIALIVWTIPSVRGFCAKKRRKLASASADGPVAMTDIPSHMDGTDSAHSSPRSAQVLEKQFNSSAQELGLGSTAAPSQGLAVLAQANAAAVPLNVTFHALGLVLKNGVRVLEGVTGALCAGRMTAVMGPSGSGKTTFLTTLAGRVSEGTATGTIEVNGQEASLQQFKSVVGFVPQEDVMIRTLTVRQVLMFSAMARLPPSLSMAEKLRIVDAVQHVLGLDDLQGSVIGDENVRGISGGQRKRVNIGIELVASPMALFLDEPTSGLDSTSSLEVLDALKGLLPLSLNITAVVHQPRKELFEVFDDLVLLAKGGKTVYAGKRELMVPYFTQLGFRFPPDENAADVALDIVSQRLKSSRSDSRVDLVQLWADYATSSRALSREPSMTGADALELAARVRNTAAEGALKRAEPVVVLAATSGEPTRVASASMYGAVALAFAGAGIVVTAVLLGVRLGDPPAAAYLWITVPFCSLALALYLACAIVTAVVWARRPVLLPECAHFTTAAVTGPVALLGAMIVSRKSYRLQLFASAGFASVLVIVLSAMGALVYMRDNSFSSTFRFNADIGASYILFVGIVFAVCLLVASALRIHRQAAFGERPPASFVTQLALQTMRAVREVLATPASLLLDFMLPSIAATFLGATTIGKVWSPPLLEELAAATGITQCPAQLPAKTCRFLCLPQVDPFWGAASFLPLAVGLIAVISSLRFFANNKANFVREQSAGLSTTAVFLAKSLVSLIITAIGSAIFLAFWGYLVQPPASPGLYFLLFWLIYFCGTSIGFLTSILLRYDLAGMIGILTVLVCSIFSKTVSSASGGESVFQEIISYFSFLSWGGQAFYIMSVAPYNATLTPWMMTAYNISPAIAAFSWNQVLCLAIALRLIAWLALVRTER